VTVSGTSGGQRFTPCYPPSAEAVGNDQVSRADTERTTNACHFNGWQLLGGSGVTSGNPIAA
jgi:hypothetical protein